MMPSITPGKFRRAPSKSDVQMLIALGYSITGVYGNAANGGGRYGLYNSESEHTAAVVNDSLLLKPTEPDGMMFNAADLLGNDIGISSPAQLCMEIIGGAQIASIIPTSDSVKALYGKDYVFVPGEEFYGRAIMRYLAQGKSISNIGYTIFSVKTEPAGQPCPPSVAPFLCNGGFEETKYGGSFESFTTDLFYHNCSIYTPLTGWRNMPYSPDILTRRRSGRPNLYTYFFPVDLSGDIVNRITIWPFNDFNETWDKDISNEVMVGLRNARFYLDDSDSTTLFNRNEGVVQVLTTKNADRNGYYVLDIHVYGIGSDIGIPKPAVSSRISATVTSKDICTLYPDWEQEISPQDYGGQIILDSIFLNSTWHKLRGKPFRMPESDYCFLVISGNKLQEPVEYQNYILIDDVRLRPAGFGLDVVPSMQFPCPGEIVPFDITVWWDDSAYVRPLTLQAFLPASMELIEGDFKSNGEIITAIVPNQKMDSSGRVAMTLLARLKDNYPNVLNSFQTIRVVPKDEPKPEVYGKISASVAVAPPGLEVGKTITDAGGNDSLTYFKVRTTVCNTLTKPVNSVSITDSLPAPLQLIEKTVSLNGNRVAAYYYYFNPEYRKEGDKITFCGFDLPPYWISSSDSLGACTTLEYTISAPKGMGVFDIPSEITAPSAVCRVLTSAGLTGKKLGASTSRKPHIETIYPNPCSALANVVIDLPKWERIRLEVVDLLGRTVQTLASGMVQSGRYQFTVETADLRSGTYLIILKTDDESQATLLSVVK
ncbi:hypothetical protein MASR2M18_19420 [Ignavibacteria bacterium]|nr:T9SS type A sorting domain-containing protein [Bacteroidota bacterium]MCZ2132247.1 T9SS type A sorting domain-containing protein [Bacteroidota bacterium]